MGLTLPNIPEIKESKSEKKKTKNNKNAMKKNLLSSSTLNYFRFNSSSRNV